MNHGKFDKYIKLREKYPSFVYRKFDMFISGGVLNADFHFEIPGLAAFKPHWEIPMPDSPGIGTEGNQLKMLIFSLGMAELISYWKLTCSPEVRIDCCSLADEQVAWWKKLYKKGLGEFFYVNGIDTGDDFMKICHSEEGFAIPCGFRDDLPQSCNDGNDGPAKVLIPIGGGKDSAVTLELLRGHADRYCYMINPGKASPGTVKAAQIPPDNVIIAKRTLDENMLALNKQGFLNGHTPFSAIVAFSSVIAAYVYGIKFVALSNEASACEPTVAGTDVNHQYSKSLEFESDFVDYEKKYISSGVKYFSLLRPLNELKIAEIFSRLKQYHGVFRSCNAGSKEGIWCAGCPKCLFVYIMLAPFLPKAEMINIFGKDMLDDAGLLPVFDKLIGAVPEKPFECVGSRDEVNAAMQELIRQYESDNIPLTAAVKYYKDLGIKCNRSFSGILNYYNKNNHIPERFISVISDCFALLPEAEHGCGAAEPRAMDDSPWPGTVTCEAVIDN